MLRSIRSVSVLAVALVLAACTGAGASPSPTAGPISQASEVPSTPAATANACAPGNLQTVASGVLTIGTDNPAYPPYFAQHDGPYPSPWEALGYTGDPTSGQGFESAVAYAVAHQLGFSKDQVNWVVVPFDNSYAPGKKTFDFDINQVSYTPDRAENVDMSDGYYDLNQAVVALKANPVAKAASIADLKAYKFGAQIGTTSYQTIQDVIAPTTEAAVYNTNDAAIQGLKDKQIDAIVVDLPTADFIVNVQIGSDKAVIVGQLQPASGTNEHFSLVLGKGSPLTACVNQAIAQLKAYGALTELAKKYLPFQEDVPVLK
ncbi:MAG TPA: ABC transporter substrate-binding protein [Candidatus Limnocylindrales bacterium]|nr:ABC transporter substrate-binding protein [Candidatus Limnocylindrales bacterium]